jgi:UDP-N-acetylmuramoylalanine--D-glutamate ligase
MAKTDWKDRPITILGLGKSGRETALYLAKRGARITVSESKELNPADDAIVQQLKAQGVTIESGGHSQESLASADLIVTSPGVKPSSDVIQRAIQLGKPVVCDVEIAYQEANVPIVAITGTNGKSTTTALISFILEKNGMKAPACGNFGVPVLSALESGPTHLVIEVSSFQLYYSKHFAPDIGIWLNLTPDHVDWHGSLDAYIEAKECMFRRQISSQYAVLNMDDPIVANCATKAEIFPFSIERELTEAVQGAFITHEFLSYRYNGRSNVLIGLNELNIIGKHNLENALAAISAAALLGLSPTQIGDALKQFEALEHRLEYVDTIDGVRCYNDSKATNTDSAIKALQSFKERIVLIAGGRDKGTALDEFVRSVVNHTSAVILLGEAKNRFEKAMLEGGVQNIYTVESMEEAVDLGIKLKSGPLVLSPACASFDMFKDFEDRGRVFKNIIHSRR